MEKQFEIVRDKFNERWSTYKKGYDALVGKMEDEKYVARDAITISQVHRAVMTNRYIMANYKKGSCIIDAACGNGFNSCYLAKEGYDVSAFDVSVSAIEQASELALAIGLPKEIFKVADQSILGTCDDASVDVVIAMGLMRYLEDHVRDYIYKEVKRILKPGGCFSVSNDNMLFEIFALNDGTLHFWSEVIDGFSDAKKLLPNPTVIDALEEHYPLSKRQYEAHSASKHIKRHAENPLIFSELAESYGFRLDKIVYPNSHLLPPLLEKKVDTEALETMKAEVCLSRAENDWRSMFMENEFVAFLKK